MAIAFRKAAIIAFASAGTIALAATAQAQSCDAPTPNMQIAKPGPSVSPAAVAFSGVWGGTWTFEGIRRTRASLCARLYVSVKDDHTATINYCYGSRSDTGVGKQCDQYSAVISGNVLKFDTNFQAHVTFTSNGGNALAAEFHTDSGRGSSQTDFERQSP
jgi:hypothetical protein